MGREKYILTVNILREVETQQKHSIDFIWICNINQLPDVYTYLGTLNKRLWIECEWNVTNLLMVIFGLL